MSNTSLPDELPIVTIDDAVTSAANHAYDDVSDGDLGGVENIRVEEIEQIEDLLDVCELQLATAEHNQRLQENETVRMEVALAEEAHRDLASMRMRLLARQRLSAAPGLVAVVRWTSHDVDSEGGVHVDGAGVDPFAGFEDCVEEC